MSEIKDLCIKQLIYLNRIEVAQALAVETIADAIFKEFNGVSAKLKVNLFQSPFDLKCIELIVKCENGKRIGVMFKEQEYDIWCIEYSVEKAHICTDFINLNFIDLYDVYNDLDKICKKAKFLYDIQKI